MSFQTRRLGCSVPGPYSLHRIDGSHLMRSESIFLFYSHCSRYGLKPNYCTLFKPYSKGRVIDFVMDFLMEILANVYEHFTNNLSSQLSNKESRRKGAVVVKDDILTLVQN